MDYLLSRESYASNTSNLLLKLGRSCCCAELTQQYSTVPFLLTINFVGQKWHGTRLSSKKSLINRDDDTICTTKLLNGCLPVMGGILFVVWYKVAGCYNESYYGRDT